MRYTQIKHQLGHKINHIFGVYQGISLKFKFIFVVILCLLIVMTIGVWNLDKIQGKIFENQELIRTKLVLNFGQASRNYVVKHLAPAVEKYTDEMIFEAKSNAFATRKIFELFNEKIPEYIYRQTALNPLNLADTADEFEAQIIANFNNNRGIKNLTGYKQDHHQEFFYVAEPILVEPSCWECHGTPESAPRKIVETYGTTHGYNWKIGDIVSALIIYVPTKDLQVNQTLMIESVLGIFICLTITLIILIYISFDKLVGRRIEQISHAMNQAALNPNYSVKIDDSATDEIGIMAKIFNRMTDSLNDLYTHLELKVEARTAELEQTLQELKITQTQLIENEKMSSLGQLVAGIAHEINNPVSFISGNLNYAQKYTQDLITLIHLFQQYYPELDPKIQEYIEEMDLDFLAEDLPKLLTSMQIGSDRISNLVLILRNFSRLDEAEMKYVDIHEGIESTLVILHHRLQPKSNYPRIEIIRDYENLPSIECYPGQLNQVFMNVLNNAIDAIKSCFVLVETEKMQNNAPQICIKTKMSSSQFMVLEISDNGVGMTKEVKEQIFNPFFTTKPVGQGTGLGLSISYKIIVEKHHGSIVCESALGKGTTFYIKIPVRQTV